MSEGVGVMSEGVCVCEYEVVCEYEGVCECESEESEE